MMGYVVLTGFAGGGAVLLFVSFSLCQIGVQLKGRRHEMDLVCCGVCSGWQLLSVQYADV